MRIKRSLLIIFLLLSLSILSLACTVTRSQPAVDVEQDMVSTAVAATQTAASSEATAPSQTPAVTETPAATEAPPTSEPSVEHAAPLQAVFTDPNSNLWIWQDGSGARQLDSSGEVEYGLLSSDGSQVAYLRSVDYLYYSLWVVNTDGTNQRELLSNEQLFGLLSEPGHETLPADTLTYAISNRPYALQWLPDSSSLSFTSSPTFEGPGLLIVGDIYQLDTVTGELTLALNTASGGLPAYSPDGSLMAVVTPESISLANVDGSNYRANLVTFERVMTYSEYHYYPQVVWAPDSSHFKVVIPPADPLDPGALSAAIWQVNADGAPGSLVATLTNIFPFAWPELSPDLSRVVYQRRFGAPTDNLKELHYASVNGSEDTLIHTGLLDFVSHHPDSQHILFWLDVPTNYQLAQLDGTFMPLTDTGYARSVKWINDDTFLFFNFDGSAWQLRQQSIGFPSTVLVEFAGESGFFPNLDLSGGLE